MAENQNYIGVAMGLDVTDLKAGLSEANKQIQLANSEFRAASSGMQDWTKSTDGLSAKIKQLDSVLSMQKAKLAGLQAEYEKVAKEQGENSEAARKLKVQINNQTAVVNKTQQEFDNYSETLKQAKAGTIDLEKATIGANGKVKEFGDGAKEAGDNVKSGFGGNVAGAVAGGIAAIGAAAVAAVGSFLSLAESTREAREDMAKLTSAYEGAGMSVDSANQTFTDLYKVIGETDTAVEAAQQIALLAKSEEEAAKWAGIASGVTATFGDALKPETFYEAANETLKLGEATGAYTQMLEGTGVMSVEEFNAKLASLNTEQEKQAFMLSVSEQAMGAAGKAYEETSADIMAAREAEAQLSLAMQELGAIAEPIMTTLKFLAVDLLESVKPFVELIGTGLKGALEGTAGATDTLAEGLSGVISALSEKLVGMLPTLISTLVSVLSSLLPQLITTVVGVIPTLVSTLAAQLPVILEALISGFSQILASIGSMLPELIPIIIGAVLMIAETLLDNIDQLIDAGISLLMGLADGLIAALPQLIQKIPIIIEKLVGAISRNLPKIIASGLELLLSLREGIMDAIPELIKAIPDIIASIVKGLAEGIPDLLEAGKDMLDGLFDGFLDPDVIWKKVKALGDSIVDAAKSFFGISSPSKLMRDEIGEYLGDGVGVGMLDSLPKVKKNLNQFGNFIADNLGGIKGGLALGVAGSGTSAVGGGRSTVVNAGMTINYNGKLSRKEIKRLENDNYTAIRTRLKKEGAI